MVSILNFPGRPAIVPDERSGMHDTVRSILEAMAKLESQEETKRLFKVLTNGLYALNILSESEWAPILMALEAVPYCRRQP